MTNDQIKKLAASVPKFGPELVEFLTGLSEMRPTQTDIDTMNVERLEDCRQRMQLILLEAADFTTRYIKASSTTTVREAAMRLVENKLRSAGSSTFVSGSGAHITLDPNKPNNLYNMLYGVWQEVDEAVIVMNLLFA